MPKYAKLQPRSDHGFPPNKKRNIFWTLYQLTSRRPSNIICAQVHIALFPFFLGAMVTMTSPQKKQLPKVSQLGSVGSGSGAMMTMMLMFFWRYCGWNKSQTTTLVDLKPCKLWKRTTHQVVQDFFDQKLSPGAGCFGNLQVMHACAVFHEATRALALCWLAPLPCKRMSLVLLEPNAAF